MLCVCVCVCVCMYVCVCVFYVGCKSDCSSQCLLNNLVNEGNLQSN